jgi:O-antigen ligase
MSTDILGHRLTGAISIDPWRTQSELAKLTAYAAACWLAFCMARDRSLAFFLLNAIIATGTLYALYAFALTLAGFAQARLIYQQDLLNPFVSGPFMLHNTFATYSGLAILAATGRFFADASGTLLMGRGGCRLGLSVLRYLSGSGARCYIAMLLLYAAVCASASRGGFAATSLGLLAMAVASIFPVRGRRKPVLPMLAVGAALLLILFFNNASLGERIIGVLDAGTADDIRLTLWSTTQRMIASAPWQGLGLGTFQDAYPLYTGRFLPYLMGKAHCDYLELVAGVGWPAAILCWAALAWLALLCLQGVFTRRHDRFFPLVGFAACILVAIHSGVDFSLQIPAVGLYFVTLLGVGLGQSRSSASHQADGARPFFGQHDLNCGTSWHSNATAKIFPGGVAHGRRLRLCDAICHATILLL